MAFSTGAPRREPLLHGLAGNTGEKHHQDEKEPERTYSLSVSAARRRRRLAADAGKPNSKFTRTYPTTPANRREHNGLPHLQTALEPLEAEGTASSAGGDSAAPVRPSQL